MKPVVMMVARPDLFANPGGDTTQVRETAAALRRLEVSVSILLADDQRRASNIEMIRTADIVHCFNLLLAFQYEHLIDEARACGIPVFMSPVYWEMEGFERHPGTIPVWKKLLGRAASTLPLSQQARTFFTHHLKSTTYNRFYRQYLAGVLEKVDHLLPNSRSEYLMLCNRFQTLLPWNVVVNGCRVGDVFDAGDGSMHTESIAAPFVLSVGRIERRKNQLALIRAMEGRSETLVLIGAVNLAERSYWDRCRREAGRRGVRLVHPGTSTWPELGAWYRSARVHAQPSWFETPGLSSLEAAAEGCRIVCTNVGSAPEYFGAHATYCSPHDVASVRGALEEALAAGPADESTRLFVREHFSWQHAAEQTWNAYARLYRQSNPLALPA